MVCFNSLLFADETDKIKTFFNLYNLSIKKNFKGHVTINGIKTSVFNFKGFSEDLKNNKSNFKKALEILKEIKPSMLTNPLVEKTFWINAYNIGAKKLVAKYYPIKSIKDFKVSFLKYPWGVQILNVGGKEYSIKEIEKDLLLKKFKDPRIIFAVSCAAVSCPDRTEEAFFPLRLDKQMDLMISDFFKNPKKGLIINKEKMKVKLAWILKKDGHLFKKESESEVLDFVSNFVSLENKRWLLKNKEQIKIEYFDHDWTLNDYALKDEVK